MEGDAPVTQVVESSPDQNPIAAPPTTIPVSPDPAVRFRGLGTNFRAKLIGIDDVSDSRGDEMCQESILKLKAAVQASGRHKQKVIINVSLEGIKIVDVLTGEVQHVHPVHRISFIARDLTDRRAFGYVYGAGEGRHQFFGIKTAKVAELLVLALRDLFQVVYDMKKKEIEEAKEENVANGDDEQAPVPAPRQQGVQGETVYAVPQNRQQEGNLFDLEQQLSTIQEGINNIDAIGPWPQDLPTSPDSATGNLSNGGDLFGIANLSDISSLSSDFSCASNVVIDYGHAGGGQQQFTRTGSSRSSVSCQGLEQSLALSRSSSHRGAGDSKLSSVPDVSLNATPLQQKKPKQEETRQTVTKDTAIINRAIGNTDLPSKAKLGNQPSTDAKSEENRALSGAANDFSSGSLRKTTSVQSLPGSEKGSKRHSSGFFSRSKKSSKKSKSKKEKALEKKKHRGSKHDNSQTVSEDARPEDVIKPHSVSTTVSDLQRRDSLSSVNSVRSCIVSTAVHNTESRQKSSSRTSLNVVSSSISENQGEEGTLTSYTTDSFIVRSSICPRTRPRPKNPEKSSKDHSAKENVAEKRDIADNPAVHNASKEEVASSHSSPHSWIASFDSEFEHGSESKGCETKSDAIDPFTGLSTNELKSDLPATFEDESWDIPSALGNKTNAFATPQPTDAIGDFEADPFSSETPFENIDPFASTETEDPFGESVKPFKDPFADEPVIGDEFFDAASNKEQECREHTEQLTSIPTFPPKSEEIMFTLKEPTSHSAEESSMTSGMSTPMETQSPEHTGNAGYHANDAPPVPPAIPPRLPPRPKKKPPVIAEWAISECPNIPPPPLPDHLPDPPVDDGFEDILDEDYKHFLPDLGLESHSSAPEIPQRTNASVQNSIEDQEKSKGDIQNNSSNNALQQKSSYSAELFDLASPVAQPTPQPGAKLTKEQILSSFGTGVQQLGMFPGQPGVVIPPQAGMIQQGGMQYNAAFQQQMQGFPKAAAPMGMFPPGPSPAIPPRPGAMRPPTSQLLPGGAAQNPFGDSLLAGSSTVLAPVSKDPTQKEEPANPGKSDPFAGLIPGMGSSAAASKKDMFKNFEMAKPPQPPPRTNPPVNGANDIITAPQPAGNFDDYFRKSVGGVPLTEDLVNNNPTPVPRKQPEANDPFGMGQGQTPQMTGGDPFGGNQDFSEAFSQGTSNTQSLFG